MKFLNRIHLGILYAIKNRNCKKLHDEIEFLKSLNAFHFYANVDPTDYELKKQKLEKKIELLTSSNRYLSAKINSIKWKLL